MGKIRMSIPCENLGLPYLVCKKKLSLAPTQVILNLTNNVVGLIIIITLCPEDNIFGMNASLTYGPQLQK